MSDPFPLSRKIDVGSIPAGGMDQRIAASDAERAALAELFGLIGVDELTAELTIAPWRGEGVSATGRVRARITQRCVVSLVPVEQQIDEPIDARFVPAGSRLAAATGGQAHEVSVAAAAEDEPETFMGHSIDIGALAAEHFALAIDPYPRAPGAAIPAELQEQKPDTDSSSSPFAILEKLKTEDGIKR